MIDRLFNLGSAQSLMTNLRRIREEYPNKVIYYRGHCDKSFQLIPSVYRPNDAEELKCLEYEDKLYKELLCICPNDFEKCGSTFDRLVKMQHYSLPTRLLDVTSNPLVALYFASLECECDGMVYAFVFDESEIHYFDSPDVCVLSNLTQLPNSVNLEEDCGKQMFLSKIKGDQPNVYYTGPEMANQVICVRPRLNNSRIIRQGGAFLLFGMDKQKSQIAQVGFEKIEMVVPHEKKAKVQEDLQDLGITEAFLFPEIDKVSEFLTQKLR